MPEISLTRAPAHVRHGSNIGQPLTRRDGVLKVTGAARYAADNHPPGMLYAVLAVSSIARGRVAFLDVEAAKAHPGVVAVMTPANKPALAQDPDEKTNPFMFRLDLCKATRSATPTSRSPSSSRKRSRRRRKAPHCLSPRYDVEPARVGLDSAESFVPQAVGPGHPPVAHLGDIRDRSRRSLEAHRSDLRDRSPVSQRDGAACDRRRMGRRYAVGRYPEPGSCHGAGTPRGTFRDRSEQNPHPQSVPRRRFRLQRHDLRPAGPRRHGGPHGRKAGQAGAPPGADVWSGGTPGADAADPADRYRQRRQADSARSSNEDNVQHL